MDLSYFEVAETGVDNLDLRVSNYVDECSRFLVNWIKSGWDDRRVAWEKQKLVHLFEGYQFLKGGSDIIFPSFRQPRWNQKLANSHSDTYNLSDFLNTRATPKKDQYNTRIKQLGSFLAFKDPKATLVSVGGGKEAIGVTPFGKNIVLLDPLYMTDENIFARINGYRAIPLPYSIDILKAFDALTLGVELSFSLHHIPNPVKTLTEILGLPNIKGIIISDYDVPISSLGLPFVLENIATLFPLAAERYEIKDLGIEKFITTHSHGLLLQCLDLAERNGFKLDDLDFYPKLDPQLDNLDGLTKSERKFLERGSKFAATFVRTRESLPA